VLPISDLIEGKREKKKKLRSQASAEGQRLSALGRALGPCLSRPPLPIAPGTRKMEYECSLVPISSSSGKIRSLRRKKTFAHSCGRWTADGLYGGARPASLAPLVLADRGIDPRTARPAWIIRAWRLPGPVAAHSAHLETIHSATRWKITRARHRTEEVCPLART
jgi:hypothetical protein